MTLPTSMPSSADSGTPPGSDPPFSPTLIEELLRAFGKAVRAHQLYLPNNPVYKSAVEAARSAFAPVWKEADEIHLRFTETEIRWCDRPVLVEPTKTPDSLPWTFFKDGVRALHLTEGFEQSEMATLFSILQRVRKTAPEEDDLLTMLWEADFAHLRYRYVDLGAEPTTPLSESAGIDQVSPDAVRAAAHEKGEESRPNVVNMQDFDATLYFLDDGEVDYLRREIELEYASDLRRSVISTLLDIYESQPAPVVRQEVAELIESMMLSLLAAGHFRTVAYLLAETRIAAQRGRDMTPEQAARLGGLPARLSDAQPLGQLLQAMDETADLPPEDELTALIQQLQPEALGTLLAWLPRLQNPAVRPLVEAASGRLASAHLPELIKLIESRDTTVAMEAIRRAGAMKAPAAVPPIARTLAEGLAPARSVAVQALINIGTPGALQALERSIEDPDREIRVAAVRALAARGHRAVLPRVDSILKGKALRAADLGERMAFFEAYGALCGDGGIAFLEGLLNGKSVFGRREEPEIRACAAMALGRIGSARARQALERAVSEKDVVVRNAVSRALRGATS